MFEFTLTLDFKHIQCLKAPSELEFLSLKNYFKRKNKNSFMDKSVRHGFSDGYDSFFNDVYLPIGLWGELQTYLINKGYDVIIHGLNEFLNFNLSKDDIYTFIDDLFENTIITPRLYQYESIYRILKYRYSAQQLSTSSGKTMISYAVASYLKHIDQVHRNKKFVMIVPRAGLVRQTYDKFNLYNNGLVGLNIMPLGDKDKFIPKLFDECDVLITTYQSLNNIHKDCFNKFGTINVDEAHTAKTDSISRAIELSSPLRYRFGLSGTLMVDTQYSDYYKNLQQLGPMTMVYDPKDLINDGFAPNVNIKQITLNYKNRLNEEQIELYNTFRENKPPKGTDEELQFYKDLYKIERDMIIDDSIRMNAIIDYIKTLDKNVLVLYNDVKGEYGKKICESLNASGIYTKYIDGNTKGSDRFIYTDEIEKNNEMNLVASFGTFSTGIDLKNIHYIVLAESFKSPILIGQSIGRGLRELINKKWITLIDFVDTLYKHTMMQSKNRIEIYKKQNYKIEKDEIII